MNEAKTIKLKDCDSVPCYPLYNKEKVGRTFTFRPMTTMEEKLRLSSSTFDTTAKLIQRCLTSNENVDVTKLKLVDLQFLMYKLRIETYGKDYKITTKCPHCGRTVDLTFDLDELDVRVLPDTFKEPFEIGALPVSGDTLQCKLYTTEDYMKIIEDGQAKLEKFPDYEGDPSWILEQSRRVCTVNGQLLPTFKLEKYVETMHARDFQYFEQKYDELVGSYGIDKRVEAECPECKRKIKFVLPMTEEFFRPSLPN